MDNINLKETMNQLYNQAIKEKMDIKLVIAKAVQLGMNYQEQKIKSGIDIVFNTLH